MGYGTGAIMAVPAHDERDFAFATKFGLPIVEVIAPPQGRPGHAGRGLHRRRRMVNSAEFDGLAAPGEAFEAHRRLAGRARPRPAQGQLQAARLAHQPAALLGRADPDRLLRHVRHRARAGRPAAGAAARDRGLQADRRRAQSPLARDARVRATPPARSCGGPARRETDTMDTFVCSSWYHFRYPVAALRHGRLRPRRRRLLAAGRPVRRRRRARRHAPALRALLLQGAAATPATSASASPTPTLRNQGMIQAEDGQKMSKSKGNVVTPDSVVERYGADSLRLYELFIAPFEQAVAWSDRGVQGCYRFLSRFWSCLGWPRSRWRRRTAPGEAGGGGRRRRRAGGAGDGHGRRPTARATCCAPLHKTIRKVTARHRGLPLQHRRGGAHGGAERDRSRSGTSAATCSTPRAVARAVARPSRCCSRPWRRTWPRRSGSGSATAARCSTRAWPAWDEALAADEVVTVVVQVNGKLRDRLEVPVERRARRRAGARPARRTTPARFLEGKQVVKEIYVPGKLVNFVVR